MSEGEARQGEKVIVWFFGGMEGDRREGGRESGKEGEGICMLMKKTER